MTDDELILLVEESDPRELSPEQLELLRARLPSSAVLQRAVAGRLELEQCLAGSLTDFSVSVERIVQAAGPRSSGGAALLIWGMACALVVAVGVTGSLLWLGEGQRRVVVEKKDDPAAVAEPDAAAAPQKATPEGPADPAAVAPPGNLPQADPAAANSADPAAAEAAPQEPWTDLVQAVVLPEAGPLSLFERVNTSTPSLNKVDALKWFAEVPGADHQLDETDNWNARCININGLWKLRSPLKAGTSLRMSLFERRNYMFHLWHGTTGVTLCCYENDQAGWAAFVVDREGGKQTPNRWRLACSDEDRWRRTRMGLHPAEPIQFELRWERGKVVLSRGDVRIVEAAMPEPPDEIFCQGHALIRQLELVPAAALPELPAARPIALDVAKPSSLPWKGSLSTNAQFETSGNGQVQLYGEKLTEPAWTAVNMPRQSLYEVSLHLESLQPGASVMLAKENGEPLVQLCFYREANMNQMAMVIGGPGENLREGNRLKVSDNVAAMVDERSCWIRFVVNGGSMKAWIGTDGEHWARVQEPWPNLPVPPDLIGFRLSPGEQRTQLTVRRMVIRELSGLTAMAPAALRKQAKELPSANTIGEFLEKAMEQQPKGAAWPAWRRAYALSLLARGVNSALAKDLLLRLAGDVCRMEVPLAERLRALDDAALLADSWNHPEIARRLLQTYESAGMLALTNGDKNVTDAVALAAHQAPVWLRSDVDSEPRSLERAELFDLLFAGNVEEARTLAKRVTYWAKRPDNERQLDLWDWALGLGGKDNDANARTRTTALRHPLVVELNKENFNLLAEFEAALSSQSYDDAGEIISSAAINSGQGLVPSPEDPDLVVSLTRAVDDAMRKHPGFVQVMQTKFSPIGSLRVRRAVEAGDADALSAATVQFYRTRAAAEAHLALGDRALSAGEFAAALEHYQEAARGEAPEAAARRQAGAALAAAMLSGGKAEAPLPAVQLGSVNVSGEELTRVVNDLAGRSLPAGAVQLTGSALPLGAAPQPLSFSQRAAARLEGEMGDNPGGIPGVYNDSDHVVDWVARQIGFATVGNQLLVSNGFQLSSYDGTSGAPQWHKGFGDLGFTHRWPLTCTHPLPAGDRVFCRRFQKSGPALGAFKLADGAELWVKGLENDRWVASDPFLVRGELTAATVKRQDQDWELQLSTFHPDDGRVLASRPLARLRAAAWEPFPSCEAATTGDSVLITVGGSVVNCSLQGQVRWVRKLLWTPPSVDSKALTQSPAPPLPCSAGVIVTLPGVRAVTCLDPDTGRSKWQTPLWDVQRVLGQAEGRVFVRLHQAVVALDAATGKPMWRYDCSATADEGDRLIDADLLSPEHGLLVARSQRVGGNKEFRPVLIWLDLKSGAERARADLADLKHEKPRLGPLMRTPQKLFAFFGKDNEPQRDLIELTPGDKALPGGDPHSQEKWTQHINASLLDAVGVSFPRWMILDGKSDKTTGVTAEHQGENGVLRTMAQGRQPVRFARRIKVPAGKPAKLWLRVAGDPKTKWKLQVEIGGKSVREQVVDHAWTGDGWKDVYVDLAPWAGQDCWLIVHQAPERGQKAYGYWKRMELVQN